MDTHLWFLKSNHHERYSTFRKLQAVGVYSKRDSTPSQDQQRRSWVSNRESAQPLPERSPAAARLCGKYNTDYDQLILETSNHLDFWIHVSCRRDPKLNRHHVVYYMKKTWSDSKNRVDRLSHLSTCIAFSARYIHRKMMIDHWYLPRQVIEWRGNSQEILVSSSRGQATGAEGDWLCKKTHIYW